jgi:hypothetical protein
MVRVAFSVVIITTAISLAHLPELCITAEGASSNQVNRDDEFSQESSFAFDKENVFPIDQKPNEQTLRPLDQWPMECEGAAASLDSAVIDTKKLGETYLIMIARLGTGETSSRLNHIRLAIAEEYVLRRGSDLKYVLAEGPRVKGLGRLELYVGGRLKEVLPFKRNARGYCVPGEAD